MVKRLLGFQRGVSKKTGRPYAWVYASFPFGFYAETNGANGEQAEKYYAEEGLAQELRSDMVGQEYDFRFDRGFDGRANLVGIVDAD